MKKRKILIPEPRSRFLRVRCPQCGNEQVIFDYATYPARCFICGYQLVVPTGGKAIIRGEIIRILG
ncbi:MAG: 30S ribosomal protein S27e [Desulfurococcales archaeon]|jgi:small subunit ribosomal protein S27e|nr:30S ribosomal protein S27e [Desulfurococcales archaeon]MCI4456902.1 30S ribosomal protein S27e [Desulfurococcaceae archaeon]NAZ13755.1 30S ribosomal protein S27e [Desulfurococcales archaeon]